MRCDENQIEVSETMEGEYSENEGSNGLHLNISDLNIARRNNSFGEGDHRPTNPESSDRTYDENVKESNDSKDNQDNAGQADIFSLECAEN